MALFTILLAVLTLAGTGPGAAPSSAGRRTVTPRLSATLEIGGTSGETLLGDVSGDGRPDVVTIRGGRLVAVDTDGRSLFDRFIGATHLVAVADLDGDGHDDVVIINAPSRIVAAVDVRQQIVRWQYVFRESVALDPATVRVADFNSRRPGLETVAFPDHSHTLGDARGVFIDAGGSVFAAPIVRSVNGNQLNYPQIAIGDVDGTGDPEIVVVGRPNLLVYDSEGALRSELDFRAGDPEGRHYGTLTLADVDGDRALEAVVISDRVALVTPDKASAIAVFDLAPSMREMWRLVAPPGHLLESIPDGVGDFDGDGQADVAVNRFDGATQSIEIYRGAGDAARVAQPLLLTRFSGVFAWDVWRSGGAPVFLATVDRQARPALSYRSRLLLLGADRPDGGPLRLTARCRPVTGRYATRPLRALGRSVLASSLGSDRAGVVVLSVSAGPAFVTYTRDAGGAAAARLRNVGNGAEVLDGTLPAGVVRAVTHAGYVLMSGGSDDDASDRLSLFQWVAPAVRPTPVASFRAGGFDVRPPTAVDLDGDGAKELLVREAGKRLVAWKRDGTSYRALWSTPATSRPVVDTSGAAPREVRIFVVAPSSRDRVSLRALGADGTLLWERTFRDIPASAKPEILVGEFTGQPPRDAWISEPRTRSWAVDGASGRIVWESPRIFSFSNRSAAADTNADGIDDVVTVGNYTYGVSSGRDGRPLAGPLDVRRMGGDLFASPLLAGDDTVVLVSQARLTRAKLGGKPIWTVDRKSGRTGSDLLPGLARGADGVLRAVGGNFGPADCFVAYDADRGRETVATAHVPITDVVTADTDSDGLDEFIFGTMDGRVVALHSDTGVEAWSVDAGAFPATPTIEMLSGESPSLLVPLADGTVRVYDLW